MSAASRRAEQESEVPPEGPGAITWIGAPGTGHSSPSQALYGGPRVGGGNYSPTAASPTSPTRRRCDIDVCRLSGKYKVNFINGTKDFIVAFEGPSASAYEGGLWAIRIDIPADYPFHSPSVGFVNKIYHPNVDEASGSVCLDVINQKWSALFDLCHIFDHFLPQLLQEPNNSDPLNQVAAQHYCKNKDDFFLTVKEYISKYAKDVDLVKAIIENCPDCQDSSVVHAQIKDLPTVRRLSESLSFNSSSTFTSPVKEAPNAASVQSANEIVMGGGPAAENLSGSNGERDSDNETFSSMSEYSGGSSGNDQ